MFSAILLSLKLAIITGAILVILVVPLAFISTSFKNNALKLILDIFANIPLFLPPAILGFYILILISPNGPLGFLNWSYKFEALILACSIYSFPYVLSPILTSFEKIPKQQLEASEIDGASKLQQMLFITIPQCMQAILRGFLGGFAHTIGSFGVILMVGAGISPETRVASILLWQEVEKLNYSAANNYAISLVFISLLTFIIIYFTDKKLNQIG